MTQSRSPDDLATVNRPPKFDPVLAGRIIAIAAWKGGVGKTLLALELAYLLGAVLVDLDWDQGNATRAWGYLEERRVNAPLLDALDTGRVPKPLQGGQYRADLVPCHSDFASNQPRPEQLADELVRWAQAWGRPILLDTHPGGVPSTYGALAAAHTVVVPGVLATREMTALEGMLDELATHPLLVVPNMVPRIPPEREINWLDRITAKHGVPVGPVVGEHRWLRHRTRRMAVCAADPTPARAAPLVDELQQVAKVVTDHASRAAA